MGQVVQLDATTLLIKSDNTNDLEEIIDFVSKKNKMDHVKSFLEFAAGNKILGKDFKFNREDCYDK
ncbi:MAG: hypothetical protein FWC50_01340 [Planctomycetaceae bacterium]|nr:hypothetical protein [Planctomycetaceae bacterium]